MNNFINITTENIDFEHICCAFSDKKCCSSYRLKKEWLKKAFDNDYIFYRLDERAKVFIEYGPAEKAWLPITAPGYININCFWVSGKYKKNGLGKELLKHAESDAQNRGKVGLVTVTGRKKYHFMGDGVWFQKQGFSIVDETDTGFILLSKDFRDTDTKPVFNPEPKKGLCFEDIGLTVYYSNRCPYAEFHVNESLKESVMKRNMKLTVKKIETIEQAQKAPSPATIFSLFYNGKFLTTDLSVCLDSRFDKFWNNCNYSFQE